MRPAGEPSSAATLLDSTPTSVLSQRIWLSDAERDAKDLTPSPDALRACLADSVALKQVHLDTDTPVESGKSPTGAPAATDLGSCAPLALDALKERSGEREVHFDEIAMGGPSFRGPVAADAPSTTITIGRAELAAHADASEYPQCAR